MNRLKLLLGASILLLSGQVGAVIISGDDSVFGIGSITQDTSTGLEWLDLTVTTSRSYPDIESKFNVGGEFEGWRYAKISEVSDFFDAFGGDDQFYNAVSINNNGLFDAVAPFWGDTFCAHAGCTPGEGYSYAFTSELIPITYNPFILRNAAFIYDKESHFISDTHDQVLINGGSAQAGTYIDVTFGHALVREIAPVPAPAAIWLFGTGLIGLIGFTKRRKAA